MAGATCCDAPAVRFALDSCPAGGNTAGDPMNPLLRLVFVLILTIAPGAGVLRAATASAEAEVARLDARRIDALLKCDLPALEAIFSDQLVYVHSAGRVDTKQGYLALLAAGSLKYDSLTYDPPAKIVLVGRDTALVTGRATIMAKGKTGPATKRVLTTTTVYARSAAGWQVISYQATPVQP